VIGTCGRVFDKPWPRADAVPRLIESERLSIMEFGLIALVRVECTDVYVLL
jgi:hypothetical protein